MCLGADRPGHVSLADMNIVLKVHYIDRRFMHTRVVDVGGDGGDLAPHASPSIKH